MRFTLRELKVLRWWVPFALAAALGCGSGEEEVPETQAAVPPPSYQEATDECAAACPGQPEIACAADPDHPDVVARVVDESPGAGEGVTLARIGDVDGDGVDDLAIGLRLRDGSSFLAGLVRVVSGATRARLWEVEGTKTDGAFGVALADAGDVDGDGVPDVVAGAPREQSKRGRVYVLSGTDGSVVRSWTGAATGVQLGAAVGGGHDIDGDGMPDVVAGAPLTDTTERTDAGRVYAWSGVTGEELWNRTGADGIRLGSAVALVGDLDADGLSEVLGGAWKHSESKGRVVVFAGADGGPLKTHNGGAANDRFGYAVAGIGDVDLDGVPDYAIGASFFGRSLKRNGAVYVYSGLTFERIRRIDGLHNHDHLGFSVAAAGRFDSDEFPDIAVGAPDADPDGGKSGTAYVFSGADGSILTTTHGASANEQVGYAVAGADTNGDGLGELVAGARATPVATTRAILPLTECIDRAGQGLEDDWAPCSPGGTVCCIPAQGDARVADACEEGESEANIGACFLGEVCCEYLDVNAEGGDGVGSARIVFDPEACALGQLCSGRGTCASESACACDPGWTGACCDAPGVDCATDPCVNGGTCADSECACPEGFTGLRCETSTNECEVPGRLGLEALPEAGASEMELQILQEAPPTAGCIDAVTLRLGEPIAEGGGWELRVYEVTEGAALLKETAYLYVVASPGEQTLPLTGCLPIEAHQRVGLARRSGGLGVTGTDDGGSGVWERAEADLIADLAAVVMDNRPTAATGWSVSIATSPCANGASCVDGESAFTCACPAGYYGATCDQACPGGAATTCASVSGAGTAFRADGALAGDRAGEAVAAPGDVDGDGRPDLLVGLPGFDVNAEAVLEAEADPVACKSSSEPCEAPARCVAAVGTPEAEDADGTCVVEPDDRGAVRLVSGATGEVLRADTGQTQKSHLGAALALLGDLDGDGVRDYAAGAPGELLDEQPVGAVHVISTATGARLGQLRGQGVFGAFGAAVAPVGDLDGDGQLDLLIGVPGADPDPADAGQVLAVSGATLDVLWTAAGTLEGGHFGAAVLGIGDLDGDGVPDAVGSATGANSRSGRVVLMSGATGAEIRHWDGDTLGGRLGHSLAALDSVDGDDLPELAVGQPGAGPGRVILLAGAAGDELWRAPAQGQGGDSFGAALAALGDYDLDGTADLAVGVSRALRADQAAGSVTVISGVDGSPLLTVSGAPGDQLGAAVAAAGDFNGDGLLDVLAGAPVDADERGAARVVFDRGACVAAEVCSGHGACDDGAGGSGACTCEAGFSGDGCETDDDDCAGVSCGAHQQCLDGVAEYSCECEPTWYGGECAGQCASDALAVCHTGEDEYLTVDAADMGTGDEILSAAAIVGDTDGDRRADFVVSVAPSGAAWGRLHVLDANATHRLTVPGADAEVGLHPVRGIGDADGDGLADFAAVGADAVYVYSGYNGELLIEHVTDSAPASLAGADVDGDGRADVLVGLPDSGATGRVEILSGRERRRVAILTLDDTTWMGGSVVGLGDLDGDGADDFAVTAGGAEARVVSGQDLSVMHAWFGLTDMVLSAAGDVDGDGRPELAAVAQLSSGSWLGGLYAADGAWFTGSTANAIDAPWSDVQQLQGAGDLDGDGQADVAALDVEGSVTVYSGATGGTLLGPVPADALAAGHGDVNGDGLSDLAGIRATSGGDGSTQLRVWGHSARCEARRTCGGGTCADGKAGDGACSCPVGFEGPTCELDIDECAELACGHGQCLDGPGAGLCACDEGWFGAGCTQLCPATLDDEDAAAACTPSWEYPPMACPDSSGVVVTDVEVIVPLTDGSAYSVIVPTASIEVASLLAVVDLDGDGREEPLMTSPGTKRVHAIDQAGTLQDWVIGDYGLSGCLVNAGPAGDADGDGVGDLALIAVGSTIGALAVVSGHTGGLVYKANLGSGLRTVHMAPIGDVNGDGRGDLAILPEPIPISPVTVTAGLELSGATWSVQSPLDPLAGALRIVSGRDGTTLTTSAAVAVRSLHALGAVTHLEGGADFDSDGVPDVLVHQWAPVAVEDLAIPNGQVLLVSGRDGHLIRSLDDTDERGLAAAATLVPDTTGDGVPELAVGGHGCKIAGGPPGSYIRFYDGATEAILSELTAPQTCLGAELAAGGDWNGDGRADIAAFSYSGGLFAAGSYYVHTVETHDLIGTTASYVSDFRTELAWVDRDGDLRPSLVVVNSSSGALLELLDPAECLAALPCGRGACDDETGGSGGCLCEPGFDTDEGGACTVNVDDCETAGCQNGAGCIDQTQDAACVCLPGWTGEVCDVNLDDCFDVAQIGLTNLPDTKASSPRALQILKPTFDELRCVTGVRLRLNEDFGGDIEVRAYEIVGDLQATLRATQPLAVAGDEGEVLDLPVEPCLPVAAGLHVALFHEGGVPVTAGDWLDSPHSGWQAHDTTGGGLNQSPIAVGAWEDRWPGWMPVLSIPACGEGSCEDGVNAVTCTCPNGVAGTSCDLNCPASPPQACIDGEVTFTQTMLHNLPDLYSTRLSMARVGDIDNDGVPEYAVGDWDDANTGQGRLRIYSGATQEVLLDLSDTEGFGYSIAGIHDFDHDGFDDLLVGHVGKREVRVYSSATGEMLDMFQSGQFIGVTPACTFGGSVAYLHDVNGDGVRDIIGGLDRTWSFGDGECQSDQLGAWIVSGADLGDMLHAVEGTEEDFGSYVASAMDVDADGSADFAVSGKSTVRVYSGAEGHPVLKEVTLGAEPPEGASGLVVLGSDFNGDGHGDILIASRINSGTQGRLQLFLGGATGLGINILTIYGPVGEVEFGRELVTADLTGDGFAEIVVSSGDGGDLGLAYVLDGAVIRAELIQAAAEGTQQQLDLEYALLGTVPPNGQGGSSFAHSLASMDDVDGDGRDELLVGGAVSVRTYSASCADAVCAGAGTCDDGAMGTGECACDAPSTVFGCSDGDTCGSAFDLGHVPGSTLPEDNDGEASDDGPCSSDDFASWSTSVNTSPPTNYFAFENTQLGANAYLRCPGMSVGLGVGNESGDHVLRFTPPADGVYSIRLEGLPKGALFVSTACSTGKGSCQWASTDGLSDSTQDGKTCFGQELSADQTYHFIVDKEDDANNPLSGVYSIGVRAGGCVPSCPATDGAGVSDTIPCGDDGCGGQCGWCWDPFGAPEPEYGHLPACAQPVQACYLPGDTCEQAVPLFEGDVLKGDTGASYDNPVAYAPTDALSFEVGDCRGPMAPTGGGAGAADLVYRFVPPSSGLYRITVDAADAGFDPMVWLLEGGCGFVSDQCRGAVNCTGEGETEELVDWLDAGTPHFIVVDGFSEGAAGTYTVQVAPTSWDEIQEMDECTKP